MGVFVLKKTVLSYIGLILLVSFILMVSGCTSNTQQNGTKVYQGSWNVGTDHFGGVK